MINKLEKYPIVLIVLVVFLMLLPGLRYVDVSIMEARNFISVREIINDGNWLLTTMNGEPRFEKPPLPTWITAVFGLLFGLTDVFYLRLPGVFMIAVLGIFVFLISKLFLNNKVHSLFNALITVTSFYVFAIILEAPWDIYAHGFMIGSIYFFLKSFDKDNLKNILLSAVFFGLSFLSKGPVSIYALYVPFLFSYVITYGIDKWKVRKIISVILIGSILGVWWYLYVRIADPESFLKIAHKESNNWSNYNVRPFYYYWNFYAQTGAWAIFAFMSLLYPYLKDKVSNKKVYILSLYWTIFSLVLLSIIPEKKSRYLMPLLIPLAINTGFYIEYLITRAKVTGIKDLIVTYINFGLLGFICLVSPVVGLFLFFNEPQLDIFLFITFSLLLIALGLFVFRFLYKKQLKNLIYLKVLLIVLIFGFLPSLTFNLRRDNVEFNSISQLQNESLINEEEVYMLGVKIPELIWDYGGKIKKLPILGERYQSPNQETFLLLVNRSEIKHLEYLNENHEILLEEIYDINTVKKGSKKYNDRLTISCFRFIKK